MYADRKIMERHDCHMMLKIMMRGSHINVCSSNISGYIIMCSSNIIMFSTLTLLCSVVTILCAVVTLLC